jgi:MoaA/NifB/PqqE/SkfB family radical SAM enzyme
MPAFPRQMNVFSPLRRMAPGSRLALPEILCDITEKIQHRASLHEVLGAADAARKPLSVYFRNLLKTDVAAKALTLKVLNLLLSRYHFQSRSEVLRSRPFGLVVDPANGCNLACPGCVHSTHSKEFKLFDWDKGMLSEARFQALLKRYGTYAVQIMLCNYGEPTANLNTPKFIEMAKGYLIQTVLSTNLTVGRLDADAYVRSGLDFMYLSIDGATQPVYSEYRRNGSIDLVYDNIKKLVDAKKRLGKRTPILRWQFLAFEHNVHEIPLARERATELGVDQFTVETPFNVSWDVPEIRVSKTVPAANYELNLGTGSALSGNFDFPSTKIAQETIEREFATGWAEAGAAESGQGDEASTRSGHTCSWLYKNMVMDANGRILPCCAAPQPDVHLVFANFPDAEDNCFNSGDYRRARRHFVNGQTRKPEGSPAAAAPVPHCEKCTWNQSHTEVGHDQVALYLRTAGQGLFDDATIETLADW